MGFFDGAAGGVFSAGAGLLGSLVNRSAQKSANKTNLEMARQANLANLEIAEKTNAMNYKIMQENNAFNERMAVKMFDMENAYNSPKEIYKRYLEAGLNPGVMFGSGNASSFASAGDVATPVGQPATMIPGAAQIPGYVSPVESPINSIAAFSGIADALQKLTGSFRNSVEARNAAKKINYELDLILSQSNNQQANAEYFKFQKNIDSVFAPFERQGHLDKLKEDIKTSAAQAVIAAHRGEIEACNEEMSHIDVLIKQCEAAMKQSEKDTFITMQPLLINQLQETIKLIQAQQKTEVTKQNLNNSQASQTVQMTPYLQNQIDSAVRKNDYDMAVKTLEMIFRANGIGENAVTMIPQLVRNLIDKKVFGDDINKFVVDFLGNFSSKK